MKNGEARWVVIHMAHTRERAEKAQALLTGEGFWVQIRTVARALSSGDACYEVLALTSEAKEARDFLQESGF